MEAEIPEQLRIITVRSDVPATQRASTSSSNPCQGATCGFSDSRTTSEDARERSSSMKKLSIAVTLCLIFMAIEVVGGIKANSLAILTDAAHLLSDVAAFAISLFSLWAAGWEPNPRQSYGFFRIEILGTLISIQLIWLLAGILVYEAINRFMHDNGEVQGLLMFLVAAFGLLVNIAMAFLLGQDHSHDHEVTVVENKPLLNSVAAQNEAKKARNINVVSAYLHVLGDSIQSVGVMIGGAIIWYKPEWKIIDLICTIVFSAIVLGTTIRMLRNILEVLMESTPREIDATTLERGLCEMEEVVAIHELHIWAITLGKVLLACHVTVRRDADNAVALQKIVGYIKKEYNIAHVTIQIERE